MRAWIVSDLHLEFGRRFALPVPTDADVMICAGDLLVKGIVPTLEWLATTVVPRVPVVVVAGNHEYYGASLLSSIDEARAFADQIPNLHFLENSAAFVDGVKFVGGTLWTDFRLGSRDPALTMYQAEHGPLGHRMSDYKRIKYSKKPFRRFKAIHAYRLHVETREYIAAELRSDPDKRTVVLTHHAPSVRSIAERDRDDVLSGCYASDLEPLIWETHPLMWVHGHIHRRVMYNVGNTRIVANPRGYPGEQSGFDMSLTVEI